ncbi:NAD(P) transhydrogenase beta subunit [Paraburkholderia ribeironis]|uniref:NAD(P) transhydrogenase beta subunit n=1 Tax=Paraburkholderia ribeironis TaxID=1247936 RepID=A0A1N7SD70_9BURK|nr:NAD(P)(+) transhydrogenase (Re/Si-specific) subunit beta [Paraburkholderia ribeironis]SIT45348.1 NAD(P) transhydrogenase beta subunit [Paraburkholderia ribeironis]
MLQTSDSTAWMGMFFALAVGFAVALVSALTVAFAALGRRQLQRRSMPRRYSHAGALAAVLAGLLAACMGESGDVVGASMVGAIVGAWLVRGCELARRPRVVALLGSGMGLVAMSGGVARYLSTAASSNAEHIGLYVGLYLAVFIGALVFAACAIVFCQLCGALQFKPVAGPGHRVVNLSAILLCGWLGYGFVTGQAQPFGLAALLSMSALACAMGVHLMVSREYSICHAAICHGVSCHGDAHIRTHLAISRRGLLARIEWHGGEEQTWALRDAAPGTVRTATDRYRRGWHNSRSVATRRRECVRSVRSVRNRPVHLTTRR